jgi:hypothetical protein
MNGKAYGMRVALVILVLACLTSSGLPADSQVYANQIATYTANVHITSPQDKTYQTHTILLNFTFYTNIPESDIYSIVFGGNIDGQLGYHDGNSLKLGSFEKPYRNFYSIPINVSDGNHLLWLQVVIWLGTIVKTPYHPEGELFTTGDIVENLSQIVSFSVNTGATTPTPTSKPTVNPTQQTTDTPTSTIPPAPSPTIPEFSTAGTITMLAAATIPLIFFKKRKSKKD